MRVLCTCENSRLTFSTLGNCYCASYAHRKSRRLFDTVCARLGQGLLGFCFIIICLATAVCFYAIVRIPRYLDLFCALVGVIWSIFRWLLNVLVCTTCVFYFSFWHGLGDNCRIINKIFIKLFISIVIWYWCT